MINLDPLKPYMTVIKLGLIVVLFGSGVFTGCQWQENRDAEKIVAIEKDRDYYKGQAETNAKALVEVNKQTKANQQAAREQAKLAEEAGKEAARLKRTLAKEQTEWEREFERIKKNPDCETVLRMNLCPALKDY